MKFWTALLAMLILVLAFGFASVPSSAVAQEVDVSCSDGIDNDGDELTDADDPDCTILSEEPVVITDTPAPTDAPTDTPPPDSPTPTQIQPSTPPQTGGGQETPAPTVIPDPDPDEDPSELEAGRLSFLEFESETGLIGLLVSVLVTILTITGLTLSSQHKRLAALGIGIVSALVYLAMRDDAELTVDWIGAAIFTVLLASQAGYLLADGLLKTFLPTSERYREDAALKAAAVATDHVHSKQNL